MKEKTAEQLIAIAHSPEDWNEEVIASAKEELNQRNISEADQQRKVAEWDQLIGDENRREKERWKENESKSYKIWEMLFLLILGPFTLIKWSFFESFSLSFLKREHYNLKLKQYVALVILSIIGWFTYISYDAEERELKRIEEIENVDISDWEKNRL